MGPYGFAFDMAGVRRRSLTSQIEAKPCGAARVRSRITVLEAIAVIAYAPPASMIKSSQTFTPKGNVCRLRIATEKSVPTRGPQNSVKLTYNAHPAHWSPKVSIDAHVGSVVLRDRPRQLTSSREPSANPSTGTAADLPLANVRITRDTAAIWKHPVPRFRRKQLPDIRAVGAHSSPIFVVQNCSCRKLAGVRAEKKREAPQRPNFLLRYPAARYSSVFAAQPENQLPKEDEAYQ